MTTVEKILMRRDEMTAEQAHQQLLEMKAQVANGEDPEDVLYEIGLEPDYIFDIID